MFVYFFIIIKILKELQVVDETLKKHMLKFKARD